MVIGAISKQPIIPGKRLLFWMKYKNFTRDFPRWSISVKRTRIPCGCSRFTFRRCHAPRRIRPSGKGWYHSTLPYVFRRVSYGKRRRTVAEHIESKDWKTITLLHDKLIKILREYYFVGGMPEAVKTYLATNDANLVRQVQNNILTIIVVTCRSMSAQMKPLASAWFGNPSLPSLLRKTRSSSMERWEAEHEPRIWDGNTMAGGCRSHLSHFPSKRSWNAFEVYEDLNAFKLFLLDVGLLGALSEMEPAQMLISNKAMTESKGAFTETTSLPSYYVNRTFTPIIIVGKTLAWR